MDFECPSCHKKYVIAGIDKAPTFCPFCGVSDHTGTDQWNTQATDGGTTFVAGHTPEQENIQFSIGTYKVLSPIGKGGMGEVFLAYDTTCGRRIALKRIRSDLIAHKQMFNRFLKEAHVTSQLTHPSIIPIYAIHREEQLVYYTMPFVEGQTLRQILKEARQKEKQGLRQDISSASIPALVRIFLNICQAIAYAHSKDVLHRDIKPENIIVGPFGEVLILDWGLAKLLRQEPAGENFGPELSDEMDKQQLGQLTHVGRVVGTVAYMAPERALGQPANFQTDIYSLGVILYQILTLRYPFRRGTLKEFRQKIHKEVLHNPIDIAPYRDIPPMLSSIALKCLTPFLDQRYNHVQELIHDIENFIEGRSEWFKTTDLDIKRKSDWEFQENVLLAEHIAITRGTEHSDWVSLMISKDSFPGNTRMETRLNLGERSVGIGFLLSVPEASERIHLNDGYCLWISSDLAPSTKLLRSTVEVVQAPEVVLQRNEWYRVRIEKIDQKIYFYLNDNLQFTYISHLPLAGTHIGLLSRDADFELSPIRVSIASQNIKVNCLAVPDAFLAHQDYATALSEYRRIGYSFPGRAEGREAMFRAGITLLEQASETQNEALFEEALEEFSKMHSTPGAPLEYLGKGLVYQTLGDFEEEIKCFELALRRYPNHPLLPVLYEQITYRLHESSRTNRNAVYHFMLLLARHVPQRSRSNTVKLISSLQRHWEPLYFIQENPECAQDPELSDLHFAIQLAFWLDKPAIIVEIIKSKIPLIELGNALFALIELGHSKLAKEMIDEIRSKGDLNQEQDEVLKLVENAVHGKWPEKPDWRTARYLMEGKDAATIENWRSQIPQLDASKQVEVDALLIKAYLTEKQWDKAGELLHHYPMEYLNQETTPLHFLYGCWLLATEGKEIAHIHFNGVLEEAFPRSWNLFAHHYHSTEEQNHAWDARAFAWEKKQLERQMELYNSIKG